MLCVGQVRTQIHVDEAPAAQRRVTQHLLVLNKMMTVVLVVMVIFRLVAVVVVVIFIGKDDLNYDDNMPHDILRGA